jgi:hypothetical protein
VKIKKEIQKEIIAFSETEAVMKTLSLAVKGIINPTCPQLSSFHHMTTNTNNEG